MYGFFLKMQPIAFLLKKCFLAMGNGSRLFADSKWVERCQMLHYQAGRVVEKRTYSPGRLI
jgi:hypothetical protein